VGREASEAAFKRHAPGSLVLHLAVHGFFLGGAPTGDRETRGITAMTPVEETRPAPQDEDPMLLAGLAFAGANQRGDAGPADEDGILTAAEIAGLDLGGVEWAVLSACDTGTGEIRTGEGVLGLRRAFEVAGARTLVTSLWPVKDDMARLWMRALYEARLQQRMDTAQAVHTANQAALRWCRDKGQPAHPFLWAGFVAAGDWR
jgi:CHAT domain-containing protein